MTNVYTLARTLGAALGLGSTDTKYLGHWLGLALEWGGSAAGRAAALAGDPNALGWLLDKLNAGEKSALLAGMADALAKVD